MSKAVVTNNQPSITEWFEAIGEQVDSNAFREEDNHKVDRLETLYQLIGLPYERPEPFPARALTERRPEFARILETRGDELCAIRLVPSRPDLPKLRQRGLSIRECYETWFLKQDINPDDYTAYLCPHSETLLWSATFVVSEDAIFGEIIEGLHSQLTHGDTEKPLHQFRYDFETWQWSPQSNDAEQQVGRITGLLHVPEADKQAAVRNELSANFSHDYLMGYFEATIWPNNKVYIIDYNRVLPKYIQAPSSLTVALDRGALVNGSCAFGGSAQGRVKIIDESSLLSLEFPEGSILVCDNTDVRYLPLMKKAGAIVTNRGGILSHAAIVARELKKPCIIGTKNGTHVFEDGQLVEINADLGTVRAL